MTTTFEITNMIESLAHANYSAWTIGITDNPDERREDHGNPLYWCIWNANTSEGARAIKSYFISKGMKRGPGRIRIANYVYLLK